MWQLSYMTDGNFNDDSTWKPNALIFYGKILENNIT